MNTTTLDLAVAAARALGHSARMRIVAMLQPGELCVCQITEVLKLAPSTVSAHLKDLRLAGLTLERKDGRWVYISLADDPAARTWIETTLAAAGDDPQLAADRRLVTELRRLPVEDLCRLGYDGAVAERLHHTSARS
jgi:DNA-binding transcriptional ArsR family regulator